MADLNGDAKRETTLEGAGEQGNEPKRDSAAAAALTVGSDAGSRLVSTAASRLAHCGVVRACSCRRRDRCVRMGGHSPVAAAVGCSTDSKRRFRFGRRGGWVGGCRGRIHERWPRAKRSISGETMPLRTIPPARRRRLRAPTPLPRRQAPPRPMARRARPDGSPIRTHRPRARAVLRPMAQKRPLAAAPALPIAGLQPNDLLLTTPSP